MSLELLNKRLQYQGGNQEQRFINDKLKSLKKALLYSYQAATATMGGSNALNGTPFANDGSGGTIYIPKVLYDELGTGSSLDYKAATNWSTLDSYGTITWAQIEGSYYETHYADNTEVTT